jgi:glucose-1-phosphate cytidylyltransferase
MTIVRLELRFRIAEMDGGGRVRGFREKPRSEHWVNGGFFCFEPGALDFIEEDSVLEREPLERLAAAGQLHAFRYGGLWECMDTFKAAVLLNDIWSAGAATWRIWD